MIVLIVSVSVLVAFFVTKSLFGKEASEPVTVQTIEKIDAGLEEPDPTIFNSGAINPTVEVQLKPSGQ